MKLKVEEVTIYCIVNERNEIIKELDSKEEAETWLNEMRDIYQDR